MYHSACLSSFFWFLLPVRFTFISGKTKRRTHKTAVIKQLPSAKEKKDKTGDWLGKKEKVFSSLRSPETKLQRMLVLPRVCSMRKWTTVREHIGLNNCIRWQYARCVVSGCTLLYLWSKGFKLHNRVLTAFISHVICPLHWDSLIPYSSIHTFVIFFIIKMFYIIFMLIKFSS